MPFLSQPIFEGEPTLHLHQLSRGRVNTIGTCIHFLLYTEECMGGDQNVRSTAATHFRHHGRKTAASRRGKVGPSPGPSRNVGGLNRQGRRRWLGDVDGAIAIWADVPAANQSTDALFLSFTEAKLQQLKGKKFNYFRRWNVRWLVVGKPLSFSDCLTFFSDCDEKIRESNSCNT